ncbi:siderophore ABC transporter substrate-binding protein [Alkalihalobacillus sp. MEB130]|uniref:siderophore ABC transporter substrate-binding protein n=1 Tax=Alkalihalobacillus sp. MEB130 TaxID=2976704 RepID=UPI0028E060C9|nr:siderophore ABC transporter substrate-binding protein [Alkalihalobacillus sp. MEB130]MDT8862334.1 siderophore ABC transporter substrate-binding protein [Alkalihalobacillus sp. MEB130]
MKKSLIFLLMTLVLSLFLAACGSSTETEGEAADPVEEVETTEDEGAEEEAETEAAEEAEITVTHQLGETVIPKNPTNVVVFDMGVLDTLDTLGVNAVTAVPTESIPEYLSKYQGSEYETAGTLFEPDFEKIYDLQPDLIIISGRAQEAYDELSEIAPTLFVQVDTANYLESFTSNVELLAEIFGKEDVAAEQLATIEESLAALNEKATSSEAEGLIILANDGSISAYGPGSRFGMLHTDFGVAAVDENIEVSQHGQNISFEYIAEKDPEYLFVVDRGAIVGGESSGQQTVENDLVKGTQAYQNGNIIYLDPVYWYITAGGLTAIDGMIAEVDAAIAE